MEPNRIKILSDELINKIAAGEVVERPASVIKELLDNALDAGATEIIIYLENGGKSLIQVQDNGCGMNRDEALMSMERHATSKVASFHDIVNLASFGFRGEALPSIASVSKFTLTTKQKESSTAVSLHFEGGVFKQLEEVAANPGTTVKVANLFYNIPARRKFLRGKAVELRNIIQILQQIAIVCHHVTFRVFHDGREAYNWPGTDKVKTRLFSIFGEKIAGENLLAVAGEGNQMRLYGYIEKVHEQDTQNSSYNFLYVNGRPIASKMLRHAVHRSYEPFLRKVKNFQRNRLPVFFLFLEIDPRQVDFNVHPQKKEVRFLNGNLPYILLEETLTKYLQTFMQGTMEKLQADIQPIQSESNDDEILVKPSTRATDEQTTKPKPILRPQETKKSKPRETVLELFQAEPTKVQPAPRQEEELLSNDELIFHPWQFQNTYILAQIRDGLLLIDQHAAHERILFEETMRNLQNDASESQNLLFPLVLSLPFDQQFELLEVAEENAELLESLGFQLQIFSGNSIVVNAIPANLRNWGNGEVLIEILDELSISGKPRQNFVYEMAAMYSCKAAIKAGKELTSREMVDLVNQLFATESPYSCPHGRPTMIRLSLREIERRFKRDV